jgi:hypothetical protein
LFPVVLFVDDFRGEIVNRTANSFAAIRAMDGPSKVGNLNSASRKEEVFRFEVSVDYVVLVAGLNATDDLAEVDSCLRLEESVAWGLLQCCEHVAVGRVFEDQEDVLFVADETISQSRVKVNVRLLLS